MADQKILFDEDGWLVVKINGNYLITGWAEGSAALKYDPLPEIADESLHVVPKTVHALVGIEVIMLTWEFR